MKVFSFFFVLIFSFAIFNSNLSAQNLSQFGIKAGYISSNISVDKLDNFSERSGGSSAGVYSRLFNIGNFSLVAEVNYLQKGFSEVQFETNSNGEVVQKAHANTKLDYLSIPIQLEYTLNNVPLKPYLITGPRYDILLGRSNGVWNFSNASLKSEFANHFKSNALGWRVAGGFDLIKISSMNLGLEIFYDLDFTNSFNVNNSYIVKNNNFGVTCNLNF